MAITITRDHAPADRYLYDFELLTTSKGWAQLDSRQDASYYGTWINPERREIFCYCEGDTTLTRCDTAEELLAEVCRIDQWNAEYAPKRFSNGKAIGIDPGFNAPLLAACAAAGLGEYLH